MKKEEVAVEEKQERIKSEEEKDKLGIKDEVKKEPIIMPVSKQEEDNRIEKLIAAEKDKAQQKIKEIDTIVAKANGGAKKEEVWKEFPHIAHDEFCTIFYSAEIFKK